MRKTYIYFLKAAVDTFSRVFIINNFLPSYISLSKDKVSSVRMEWVSSLVVVKPFFDSEAALGNELMTILNSLHFDPDQNVQEAAQLTDDSLLQMRKRTKEQERAANSVEGQRVALEQALKEREAKVSLWRTLIGDRRKKSERRGVKMMRTPRSITLLSSARESTGYRHYF